MLGVEEKAEQDLVRLSAESKSLVFAKRHLQRVVTEDTLAVLQLLQGTSSDSSGSSLMLAQEIELRMEA